MTHIRSILPPASLAVVAVAASLLAQAQSGVPRRVTQPVDESRLAPLAVHIRLEANAANDRGPVEDSAPVGHILLMLSRTAPQQQDLDAFVDQLHNPRSEQYQRWIGPAEFGSRFGPADEDVAAVAEWLKDKGFVIEDIPPSKTHITFTGTVGQMRDAFHVEIHHLNINGEAHQSAMNQPQIPAALAPVVAGFRQLDDFWPTSDLKDVGILRKDLKTGKASRVEVNGSDPLPEANITDTSNGNTYYAVGPQDFYTIYNETPLLDAGITGAGVTIAVIENTKIVPADVTAFRSAFGLPAYPATPNSTEGGVNYIYGAAGGVGGDGACIAPLAAGQGNGNQTEASIDVEWAGAVAPKAIVDFVACGKHGTGIGSAGVEIAAEHIVNYLASTVSAASLSYGGCETNEGSSGTSYFSNLWEQYVTAGITPVVSSGDSGPDRCDQDQTAASYAPSVNGLGSSAYNVSAGGTDFSDAYISNYYATTPATTWWSATNGPGNSSALSYIPEKVWGGRCSDPLYASYLEFNKNPDYGTTYTPIGVCMGAAEAEDNSIIAVSGGGGGVSAYNAAPSWQSVYGVGLYSGSRTFRTLPDIAFFAASGFWGHLLTFCDSDLTPCTFSVSNGTLQSSGAGGTSFVAPQVAGLMALVRQKTGQKTGLVNVNLYKLATREYGTEDAPNTANLAECSGSAQGANVGGTCIFHDIAADTPSLQGKMIASATLEPCYANPILKTPDCYNDGQTDIAYGISSIPGPSSSTLAYYAGAGYDLTTGLGSVNIYDLVEGWNGETLGFPSTTTLTASPTSISTLESVTLTATVVDTGRGKSTSPGGKAEFYEGSTSGKLLGSGPIVATCTGAGAGAACHGTATLSVAGSKLAFGSNSIVAYFEGDAAGDDPSTSPAVNVTVKMPQAINFTSLPKTATYGVKPFTLIANGGASGNPVVFSLISGPAKLSGKTLTITGAGTVVVAANQAGNSMFAPATQVTRSMIVDKASLTVTAKNASRLEGAANPTFAYTIAGFVNGDSQAKSTTGAPSLTTTATKTSPPGVYVITVHTGTLKAKNYSFELKNGKLTVEPKG
jgi:subtilase family serine protease